MRRSSHPALAAAIGSWLTVAGHVAAQPARGFADPLLGRWDLTVHAPDGEYPSWLEVQLRKESELMGRFVGRFGSVRHVATIDYADGLLRFEVPVQYEQQAVPLRFEGTLAGDALNGATTAADGTALRFTGRRAPTLPAVEGAVWDEPIALFNGRDVAGWQPRHAGRAGCWSVADGALVVTPPCVDLISQQQFRDFRLHAEFMYPAGSNSGIYLRGRYEVQIQDDASRALDPLRLGGVYGFLAPAVDAGRAAGEWQTLDVTLLGRRVTVTLNGTTIVAAAEIPGITGGALDADEGAPGPIMLQGDHGAIRFREIVVTPRKTSSADH